MSVGFKNMNEGLHELTEDIGDSFKEATQEVLEFMEEGFDQFTESFEVIERWGDDLMDSMNQFSNFILSLTNLLVIFVQWLVSLLDTISLSLVFLPFWLILTAIYYLIPDVTRVITNKPITRREPPP